MFLPSSSNDFDKTIILTIEDDERKWIQCDFPNHTEYDFLKSGISLKVSAKNLENLCFGSMMEYLVDFLTKMKNQHVISVIVNSHILQCFVNGRTILIPRFTDKLIFESISDPMTVKLVLNSTNTNCFDSIKMELNAYRYGYSFPPLNILELEPYNKYHFGKAYRDGKSYYRYLDNTEANCLLLISDNVTHLLNKWQLINKWYKMINNSIYHEKAEKRFIRHPYSFNFKMGSNVMSKIIKNSMSNETRSIFFVYDLDNDGECKKIDQLKSE